MLTQTISGQPMWPGQALSCPRCPDCGGPTSASLLSFWTWGPIPISLLGTQALHNQLALPMAGPCLGQALLPQELMECLSCCSPWWRGWLTTFTLTGLPAAGFPPLDSQWQILKGFLGKRIHKPHLRPWLQQ